MFQFHRLRVSRVDKTTRESLAITFDVPKTLQATFAFKPGQFITLRIVIDGEEHRRSYSVCSSANLYQAFTIGVKRVKNGRVSNYLVDQIKTGDELDVMPPNGQFFADASPDNYKTYYLFAGGSGITPILSILTTVLESEPHSYVYMMYGNKTQESIMFLDNIRKLYDVYDKRFFLEHYLSEPKNSITSWITGAAKLEYQKGRVDDSAIRTFIHNYQPYAQDSEYYLCGPGAMIENAILTLRSLDVPFDRIHVERFAATPDNSVDKSIAATLRATLDGDTVSVSVSENQTLLRALIEHGHEPPYSCEGGVCSTCRCKLIDGQVTMKNNMALSDKDVANGFVLSCQSLAQSESIAISFDDV